MCTTCSISACVFYRPIVAAGRESVAASDDIGEASGIIIIGVGLILVMTVRGGASVDGIPVFSHTTMKLHDCFAQTTSPLHVCFS